VTAKQRPADIANRLTVGVGADAMRVLYRHSERFVHLTSRDVAAEVGVTPAVISRSLHGARVLRFCEMIHIPGTNPPVMGWRLLVLGREFCQKRLGMRS
jgi:hypothetical protein